MRLVTGGTATASIKLAQLGIADTDIRDEYPVFTVIASTLTSIGTTMKVQCSANDTDWADVTDAVFNSATQALNIVLSPNVYVKIVSVDGSYAGNVDIV